MKLPKTVRKTIISVIDQAIQQNKDQALELRELRRLYLGHEKHGPPVGHSRADKPRTGWSSRDVELWKALKAAVYRATFDAPDARRALRFKSAKQAESWCGHAVRRGHLKRVKSGLWRFK